MNKPGAAGADVDVGRSRQKCRDESLSQQGSIPCAGIIIIKVILVFICYFHISKFISF